MNLLSSIVKPLVCITTTPLLKSVNSQFLTTPPLAAEALIPHPAVVPLYLKSFLGFVSMNLIPWIITFFALMAKIPFPSPKPLMVVVPLPSTITPSVLIVTVLLVKSYSAFLLKSTVSPVLASSTAF